MNKDINKTLMALVPILRMNGENVTNIEAVHDWYKAGDREYMKEVAEITYDNGTVRYADIGCDSNLTAIYDVIAVIQQIKPRSKAIERIERGVYSLPSAQPEPLTEIDAVKREDVVDILHRIMQGRSDSEEDLIGEIVSEVDLLPLVQPYTEDEIQKMQEMEQAQLDKAFELGKQTAQAEIIHCRDCKHWREGDAYSYCQMLFNCGVLDVYDYMREEDDFCSLAERREE